MLEQTRVQATYKSNRMKQYRYDKGYFQRVYPKLDTEPSAAPQYQQRDGMRPANRVPVPGTDPSRQSTYCTIFPTAFGNIVLICILASRWASACQSFHCGWVSFNRWKEIWWEIFLSNTRPIYYISSGSQFNITW